MASSEDVLVQFRAGLMKVESKTLKADQRKGLVRLSQVTFWPARCSAPACKASAFWWVGLSLMIKHSFAGGRWPASLPMV